MTPENLAIVKRLADESLQSDLRRVLADHIEAAWKPWLRM